MKKNLNMICKFSPGIFFNDTNIANIIISNALCQEIVATRLSITIQLLPYKNNFFIHFAVNWQLKVSLCAIVT